MTAAKLDRAEWRLSTLPGSTLAKARKALRVSQGDYERAEAILAGKPFFAPDVPTSSTRGVSPSAGNAAETVKDEKPRMETTRTAQAIEPVTKADLEAQAHDQASRWRGEWEAKQEQDRAARQAKVSKEIDRVRQHVSEVVRRQVPTARMEWER